MQQLVGNLISDSKGVAGREPGGSSSCSTENYVPDGGSFQDCSAVLHAALPTRCPPSVVCGCIIWLAADGLPLMGPIGTVRNAFMVNS